MPLSRIEATLARNEIVGGVVVRFVTVRAFEGASVCAGNDHLGIFAGYNITQLYRESLEASFAFD